MGENMKIKTSIIRAVECGMDTWGKWWAVLNTVTNM
jgi:hypothetical protein